MPKIRFVDPDGTVHVIDASTDQSLMDVAVNADIVGIDAECGGEMACGTCHVYVDEECMDRLPTQSDDEQEAIETLVVGEVRPQSRLSCQIRVTAEFDGFLIEVPAP
jgi:2Fe-2S ferredoxin